MTEITSEMETVTDFVNNAGIKMHVLPAHENPNRDITQQNDSFHYSCKLINDEDNWFVIYFSKGIGLRMWVQQPENFLKTTSPVHVPLDKIGTAYDGPMPPWDEDTTQADKDTFLHCSTQTPPYLEEVINCLAKDARTIEQTGGNFTAWCKLMETTTDSRQAKMAWESVVKQRAQLLALLGEGQYHQLIHETDPLK